MKKFVTYIRVSTRKQGESGLGLEAQRKICDDFVRNNGGEREKEFMDVESGTHRDRKGLSQAVSYCKKNDCALVIAKLDRLARDVEFCFKIVNTGIAIHFCDMPCVNTLLLGVFASVAQYERELTSERTKKALAAKKARGESLGGNTQAWRDAYERKTNEQREDEQRKRARAKNSRYLESKDVQAFARIIKNVFPKETTHKSYLHWRWYHINTKGDNTDKILALMQDYKSLDESGCLFSSWNFDTERRKLQVRLATYIKNIRTSIDTYNSF